MAGTSPRRSRTTSRGDTTKEAILEAVVEILREHGYAGISIAAVCERADVAPTSVYWHFGSKAGLMEAMVERISGGHVERIRTALAGSDGRVERLDRVIASLRDLVVTQPLGSLTSVALLSEGRTATPELLQALREARRRELELITADFEAELGAAGHRGGTLATLTVALTNYAALCYRMDRDESQVDRVLVALREAILLIAGTDSYEARAQYDGRTNGG